MSSEFQDEYQDWLEGSTEGDRKGIFDESLSRLALRVLLAVPTETSVQDAVERMNDKAVGCVLVLDDGVLRGIFTERDVLTRVVGKRRDMSKTPVGEVMTENPHTLTSEATLAHALQLMTSHGYRHIPVVDDGGVPLGVVSMRQLVREIALLFPNEVLNAPPEGETPSTKAEGG